MELYRHILKIHIDVFPDGNSDFRNLVVDGRQALLEQHNLIQTLNLSLLDFLLQVENLSHIRTTQGIGHLSLHHRGIEAIVSCRIRLHLMITSIIHLPNINTLATFSDQDIRFKVQRIIESGWFFLERFVIVSLKAAEDPMVFVALSELILVQSFTDNSNVF